MISVVMPCYNAEKLVGYAIQSILRQSINTWELIVVDDASTDNSLATIHSFQDDRIRVLPLKVNNGYPIAMNAGIAIAHGKYIARMDADDVCLPNRLEEQLKALELYPKAAFCGLNRYRITPGNKLYCDRKIPIEKYKVETWEDLMNGQRLFTDASVLVEREKLEAVGNYRSFQRSGMDVDLWLRLVERFGPCITITAPMYGRRLEPGSLVFNPETRLINQIPRALALQRRNRGSDDIMDGIAIDMEHYVGAGWISPVQRSNSMSLYLGTAATCVVFSDWIGFMIYFRKVWNLASGTSKFHVAYLMLVKILHRLLRNPYRLYQVR